jgi:membrane-bound metal-dependent hydrolase YbcI (DUF457 family)
VEKVSLGIYDLTRGHRDPHRDNGHRTFTHTLPFNVGAGFGVFELCLHYGKPAVLAVLFFTFAMAVRGLFEKWAARAGWLIVTLVAAAGTVYGYEALPAGRGYPMLGVALGVGGLIHILGDMLTRHGCPVLWPLTVRRGRRWYCVGLPDAFSVKVGGKVEVYLLRTTFWLVSVLAAGRLFYHPVLQRFNIKG